MFTGQSDPDTLLSSLIIAHDQHQQVVEVDLKEEVREKEGEGERERERERERRERERERGEGERERGGERRWRRGKIKQVLAYYHL